MIYLHPLIVLRLIKYLKHIKLAKQKFPLIKFLKNLIRQIINFYYLSILEVINPKLIISLIDNHSLLSFVSKNYKNCKIVAIQNGSRTRSEFLNREKIFLQHFFCFGDHEKTLFSDLGHKVENYYPVGSLIAGKFWDKSYNKIDYDICVVSCWRGAIEQTTYFHQTMESMRVLDKLVSKYKNVNQLKVVIALRTEKNSIDREIPNYGNEKEYFQRIYGEKTEIIDADLKKRNIFQIMKSSNIIISSGSTASIEAFGFGKKVLIGDFTGTKLFNDWPEAILTNDKDYKNFKKRLDLLIKISQKEYEQSQKKIARYLMNHSETNPAHNSIIKKIEDLN